MGRRASSWSLLEWFLLLGLIIVIGLSVGILIKASTIHVPNNGVIVQVVGVLNSITDVLEEFIVFGRGECSVNAGMFDVEAHFPQVSGEYLATIRFDNVRDPTDFSDPERTNITYFPGVYQITGSNLPVLPNGTNALNHTRFKQFQATSYSVAFFFNVSYFTVLKNSRRLSVSERNVEDRGPNNLEQRRLMVALTANKIACRYADRVTLFVTNVYDSWVVHKQPVLSSFKDQMIVFFLNLFLGTGNHPQFVKDYLNDYFYFIAINIDNNIEANIRTMRAHLNNKCVRAYFEERILHVVETSMTDTITYHWMKSGMPLESAVTEAIRAITAFGPLINAVKQVVTQEISHIPITNGTFGYSFLKLFRLAGEGHGVVFNPPPTAVLNGYNGTSTQFEINVVREFLRIMVPDNLLVSTDTQNNCDGCSNHTQARHIPQLIELRAEYDKLVLAGLDPITNPWSPAPTAIGWIKAVQQYDLYNPTRYLNFMASYDALICEDGCSACLTPSDKPTALLASIEAFTNSTVDGETLIPPGETVFIPVFPQPIYAPFGLGATRNPYESLIQYILVRLFDTIECLHFVNVCTANPALCNVASDSFLYPLIPLAPVTSAPDSLFVSSIQCPNV